jgi:ABC-type glutathione transport system ATPase component
LITELPHRASISPAHTYLPSKAGSALGWPQPTGAITRITANEQTSSKHQPARGASRYRDNKKAQVRGRKARVRRQGLEPRTRLELRDISRSYGEGSAAVNALHEVSLSVDQGEMVAVMGPSGSGKSTLLTIAGTLEEPSSGQVLVGGQPVGAMSHAAKARLRRRTIGYVFQDFNLLPGLTAAENVALPLELDGTSARKARVVALKSLDRLGLGGRASHYPDQLSAA